MDAGPSPGEYSKLKADHEPFLARVKEKGKETFSSHAEFMTIQTIVPSMDVLRALVMEKTSGITLIEA